MWRLPHETGMKGLMIEFDCFSSEKYSKIHCVNMHLEMKILFFVIVWLDALLLNGGQVDIPNERNHVCEEHPKLLWHEVHIDELWYRPHLPIRDQERNKSVPQLERQLIALALKLFLELPILSLANVNEISILAVIPVILLLRQIEWVPKEIFRQGSFSSL